MKTLKNVAEGRSHLGLSQHLNKIAAAQDLSHLLNAPTKNTSRKPGPMAGFRAPLVIGGFPICFFHFNTFPLSLFAILTSKVKRKRLLYLLGFNEFNFTKRVPKCHFHFKQGEKQEYVYNIFHGIFRAFKSLKSLITEIKRFISWARTFILL